MSYYGGTVTVAGRNLITSLMAGKTIEFTRIMVGSGSMPEGVEPIDMVTLVAPVAEGVASVPTVENSVLSMVVEYRNDLNGGLKESFWLREFGVFAKTEDTEEILFYYATLGDSPQPVNAYRDNRIDIRRYPISIVLELDADAKITYNPGAFITSAEAEELVRKMVQEAVGGVGAAIIKDITIPHTGWTWQEGNPDEQGETNMDEYCNYVDVPVEEATEAQFPSVALHKAALETAKNAGLCPTVQTLAGALRFWAKSSPDEDMEATIALVSPGSSSSGGGGGSTYVLPVATATRLGGVKVGKGISVAEDGTITASTSGISPDDMASTEDTESMLDEVFPSEGENP
jgi:hypothetical protein